MRFLHSSLAWGSAFSHYIGRSVEETCLALSCDLADCPLHTIKARLDSLFAMGASWSPAAALQGGQGSENEATYFGKTNECRLNPLGSVVQWQLMLFMFC